MKGPVRVESTPSPRMFRVRVLSSPMNGRVRVCPAAAAATVDAAVVAVAEVGATAVAVVVVAADQELTEWDTQSEVLPSRW